MKKSIILTGLAILALSCSREGVHGDILPSEGEFLTIHASVSTDVETSASITDAGVPSWQNGDAIALWNGTEFVTFTLSDAASGAFTGPAGEYTGIAVFPAAFAGEVSLSGDLSINLPSVYTWQEGQTNAPMIALSESDNYVFYPVSGLFKFSFTNIPADATSLRFSPGSRINGAFSIGEPEPGVSVLSQADAQSDPEKVITITIPAGHPSSMSFYIPVPVSSSGYNGFSVSIVGDDGVPAAEISSSTNFTVARSQMRRFKSKDCSECLPAKVYLIGGCLDPSWDWSENNVLTKGDGTVYTGSIDIVNTEGFKIYLNNDWNATWLGNDQPNSTAEDIIVVGGEAYSAAHGGDPQFYPSHFGLGAGRYNVTLDISTKRIAFVAENTPEKLYMVGGSFNPSWQFSESLALSKNSDGLYTASGIQMAFGDNDDVGFRIYTVKNDWGLCYTYGNGGYDANGIQLYYHDAGGEPPQIFPGYYGYEDGTYDVSFNINTMVLTLTPSPVLYLVGSPFTWGWNFNGTPLTRQSSGLYTASDIAMNFGPGDYGFRIYTAYNDWNNLYTYKDGGYDSTGIQLAYHDAGGDPPQIFPGYCGFASGTYDLTFDISSMWLTLTKK